MAFQLRTYHAPDFTQPCFQNAPEARLVPAPADGIAPTGYHAMSIFPEYFKIDGAWHLAEESRMDCVAVWENGSRAGQELLIPCSNMTTGLSRIS